MDLAFDHRLFKNCIFDSKIRGVGYVVDGNPRLRPEKSRTVNADLEYSPLKNLSLSFSVFRNVITDLIQYNYGTSVSEFATFQLTNIKEAYTRGGEFGLRSRPFKYTAFELGLNYTETRDLTSDRPLEGRAMHQATTNLFINAPMGWELAIRTKWIGKRPYYSSTNDFAGSSTTLIESQSSVTYGKEFALVNLRLEKKILRRSHVIVFSEWTTYLIGMSLLTIR
jgi:outer membrane receptor for ferrienterochelin and colicins